MVRTVFQIAALTSVLITNQAHAKLINATLPIQDESTYSAVHRPTGCLAQVVLRNDKLYKANITDPQCLPQGVAARNIPGTLFDFLVTPK